MINHLPLKSLKISYHLRIARAIGLLGLLLPAMHCIHGETRTFREGEDNGYGAYSGTADTYIAIAGSSGAGDETGTNYGTSSILKIEDDPGQSNGQGLIRFDTIFGAGAGQIPPGATITSATLSFTTVDGGFAGTTSSPSVHRMLVAWDEDSVTWDALTGGVDADGTDAAATADDSGGSNLDNGEVGTWDVQATVQAWSGGATNHGFALLGTTQNAWDAVSSEAGTVADRPSLVV